MKFTNVLLFVLLSTISAQSQPYINIVNFQVGKYEPSKIYKGSDEWKTKNDILEISLNAPIKFNANQLLLFSPRWMQKNYTSSSTIKQNVPHATSVIVEGTSTYNSTYNSLLLPITWIQSFKDSTKKIIFSGMYRFNYEKKIRLSSDNDQLGGAILYSKKYSKKFGWSAGVFYNRETFGDLFLPLLGVDWRITDRFFCWATFPQNASIDYTLASPIHVGLGFRGVQESYTEIGLQNYFTFSEGQLRLYAEYYIPKTNFVITCEGGNTLERKFIFFNKDYKYSEETKIRPTENMFARIGISFRIVTDDSFKTKPSPSH